MHRLELGPFNHIQTSPEATVGIYRVLVRCTIFKWNHEKMKRKTVPSLSEIEKKIKNSFLVN